MKNTKWIVLLLVLTLALAACGGGSQTPATEAAATEAGATEATETATQPEASGDNVLVMATNAAFPPYEFYEGDKIVGIDADVAAAIAEKLGMTLRIDDMEFNAIIPAIASGKADVGLAGMSVTEDRLVTVDFSEPYAKGIQAIVVKEGSPIAAIEDLEGKKIGVQLSTTGDIYVTGDYGEESVQRFNKGSDAILALTQDKVDAVVIDNEPAKAYVAANEGLVVLETKYAEEDYAIAFAKGNTELKEKVDTALKELIEDGTLQSIVDKYIKP